MGKSSKFEKRLSFGKTGQDILINFLERHFGYKFEAGERGGTVLNTDLIEELEHCEYIPASLSNGSRLKFVKNNKEYILTMPDVLMSRNSSDGFYWIEAKRHESDHMELRINKNNFLDYKLLYQDFTRQKFYVMCLNPDEFNNTWNVYTCEFGTLLEVQAIEENKFGNSVLIWSIQDVMTKLNKYPIDIAKYE